MFLLPAWYSADQADREANCQFEYQPQVIKNDIGQYFSAATNRHTRYA